MTLDNKVILHLRWFTNKRLRNKGAPLRPPRTTQDMFRCLHGGKGSLPKTTSWHTDLGTTEIEVSHTVNILEMLAVLLAFRAFEPQLRHTSTWYVWTTPLLLPT